jgi:hypothetical protein
MKFYRNGLEEPTQLRSFARIEVSEALALFRKTEIDLRDSKVFSAKVKANSKGLNLEHFTP